MDTITRFLLPGIVVLLTLASGFWLSSAGKPLNGIIFNVHKLIALAAVVITTIQIVNALKTVNVQALLIMLMVVTGLCVAALFASGALMSIGKINYDAMLTIHKITTLLAVLALAAIIYRML